MKTWTKSEWQKWIEEWTPCSEALLWWDWSELNPIKLLEKMISEGKLDWANWAIARLLGRMDRIAYAVYAAEQVIDIFERAFPTDKRPRAAIDAAKKYLADPSAKNKSASAASAAADAAYAAAAASSAADAAYAATAAASAAYAAYARKEMKIKILRYGIGLLEGT